MLSAYPFFLNKRRREDLEDLLADPQYFQAVFHTLPQVKLLYQGQAELGSANESIASTSARRSLTGSG